ncbi:MAG: BTAD domain-containing putative transcriptional regulator, partial [Ilumatobacteraceae bacterium]
MRVRITVIAVRGERLALTRLKLGTSDAGPGAPYDELLHLFGLDGDGRIALQISFDVDDIDTAMAELDAAYARSEEGKPQAGLLANTATRLLDRYLAHFAKREWQVMTELLSEDFTADDRRRVVNGGIRTGRDAEMANVQVIAQIDGAKITSKPVATRGDRLFLARHSYTVGDWGEASLNETIDVVEMNANNQLSAHVVFDLDDIDAAFKELEARFLTGDAAPYARVWQQAVDTLGEVNRHEPGPMLTSIDYTDHRRVPFAPSDFGRAVESLWTIVHDARYTVKEVHALDECGTVASLVIEGTDVNGNEVQWARCLLFAADPPRMDVYEEADIATALARFDELQQPKRRLDNTANRVLESYLSHFQTRDWDTMAAMLAENLSTDDRRRVVNAGVRRGRESEIATVQFIAEAGGINITSTAIATRGERLVLARHHFSAHDWPEPINEMIDVVEINAENQISSQVAFDIDDVDAAFQELDARYVAGEAAAHARTWSLITEVHAEFNRHELHAVIPDYVDHRSLEKLDLGDPTAKIRTTWDSMPELRVYIEAVHHLSDFGAIVTQAAHGATRTGFEAEWRVVEIQTVENDRVSHAEIFDETDLDEALARFDDLQAHKRRVEHPSSDIIRRFVKHFAEREWDALSELFAVDYYNDDRRRVVNAGTRQGRGAAIEDLRVAVEVGLLTDITVDVIASRGERLILTRLGASGRDHPAIQLDVLQVIEYDEDHRIAAAAVFDPDDIDAALAELDARYLAGDAAAHAHTWSVIAEAHTAFNRRELPTITPDFLDHRPLVTVETGDPTAKIREMWEFTPDLKLYIEAVHRLSDRGAVFTQASHGTSRAGFEAEWRVVEVVTVGGDSVIRGELFDETDLDTALARFDELNRRTLRLENAASQLYERFKVCFAARDWEAMVEILSDGVATDDRRRVVNAGVRVGRDAVLTEVLSFVEFGSYAIVSDVIATRGARLILNHSELLGENQRPLEVDTSVLEIIEIDLDGRLIARVAFDSDDLDAAFAELDRRYLAGEAAAHASTWSAIVESHGSLQRRQIPATTPNFVSIDHRRVAAYAPGDLVAYVEAGWELDQDIRTHYECVHRLNNFGAVVTHAARGTSRDSFEAEWHGIDIVTVDGGVVSRCELFDESDLDAALARFNELQTKTRGLENTASRVVHRFQDCFAARDWDAMAHLLADDIVAADRRPVMRAGGRRGAAANIADWQGVAEVGF